MNLGQSLVYLCMVVGWVLGIAASIVKGYGGLIILGCVFLPPMAWVVAAMELLR